MSTVEANAELARAARNAAAGIIDPKLAEEACRHMDKAREEIRNRTGELNIAVDLIREVRDET
jgi:hypothetical protein